MIRNRNVTESGAFCTVQDPANWQIIQFYLRQLAASLAPDLVPSLPARLPELQEPSNYHSLLPSHVF